MSWNMGANRIISRVTVWSAALPPELVVFVAVVVMMSGKVSRAWLTTCAPEHIAVFTTV